MQSEIVNGILELFDFILVFVVAIILIELTLNLTLKKREITDVNMQLYGVFVGLSNKEIISLAIATLRFIFILWCILVSKEMISMFLVFLLVLCIIYHIINFSIIEMILDAFNSSLLYVSLLASNLLYNYITELNFNLPLLILSILLKVLVFVYSLYFFFKTVNELINKNRKETKNE